MARNTTVARVPMKRGVKKKSLETSGGGGRQDMVWLKKGEPVPLQFLGTPDDDWFEYREHSWSEDGKWHYVPCLGKDDCPLCDDESDDRSKTRYQWLVNVYNLREKKVQVLKGGKNMGTPLYLRYEQKPTRFTSRVIELTAMATSPVTYDAIPSADIKPVKTESLKLIDLEEWAAKEASEFFGDLSNIGASSLDEPEPGDECPECGTELDEDGECPNPECEWDPAAADDAAPDAEPDDECPECGELLNEDGECENTECDAYEEPAPPPPPRRKAKPAKRKPVRARR